MGRFYRAKKFLQVEVDDAGQRIKKVLMVNVAWGKIQRIYKKTRAESIERVTYGDPSITS